MDVRKIENRFLRAARFLGKLPATAIFVYLGLVAIPVVALVDVFIDFPRGDQDWRVYLMYWPTTMLFGALFGLLADVFERLRSTKGKRDDISMSN